MQSYKSILNTFLAKKSFHYFGIVQPVLDDVFLQYKDKVKFSRICDGVFFVSVSDHRLLFHFSLIKKEIQEKIKEKLCSSIIFSDIKFFFAQKESLQKEVVPVQDQENPSKKLKSDHCTSFVQGYIERHCVKKELHGLLFELYVSTVLMKK